MDQTKSTPQGLIESERQKNGGVQLPLELFDYSLKPQNELYLGELTSFPQRCFVLEKGPP